MSRFGQALRIRASSYRECGPSGEHTSEMLEQAADELDRLRVVERHAQLLVEQIRSHGTHEGWKNLANVVAERCKCEPCGGAGYRGKINVCAECSGTGYVND